MSVDKFKFVSPGIFVDEIDNSQPNKVARQMGPVVIGRTRKGPGMRPVRVGSFSEFVEIFGDPVAGGETGDLWRKGDVGAPMYAPYAAQAWLKNNSPVTVVRLLGEQHSQATDDLGEAGWKTTETPSTDKTDNGGAFGLFLVDSGSTSGTLAAVFYIDDGSMYLSGNLARTTTGTSGSQVMIESVGANGEFRAIIRNAGNTGADVIDATFNFDRTSDKFIRKVFNTDPTKINDEITADGDSINYWLGESFEDNVARYVTGSAVDEQFGVLLNLSSGSYAYSDRLGGAEASESGWIISQDTRGAGTFDDYSPQTETKLFKFVSLDSGAWNHKNIKISIDNIKPSPTPMTNPWGTFDVIVRKITDSDRRMQPLEHFAGCNLNPGSPDYVAVRIGDVYLDWDETYRRHRSYGNYSNRSKYVRVVMGTGNISEEMLPFGFFGPTRFNSFTATSGSAVAVDNTMIVLGADGWVHEEVRGAESGQIHGAETDYGTVVFAFPDLPLREDGVDGGLSHFRQAFWGADFARDLGAGDTRFADSVADVLGRSAGGLDPFDTTATSYSPSWYFSLDDIVINTTTETATYTVDSRKDGDSYTAANGAAALLTNADAGCNRFTLPLYGGSDGFDITEKDPFRNTLLDDSTNERENYGQYSIRKAIDMCSDPEVVEFNVAALPGITTTNLTDQLMEMCADRADALALVDIENDYVPAHESDGGSSRGDVDSAVQSMKLRNIDNSYAAAYYPWVQISDRVNGRLVWAPPSVAMLGVLASSERKKELWFAPAGFTRGGLTQGAAGVPVINVRQHLTSRERDLLYENRINPIASFPNEGIVVFGQKTLKAETSALTRVNVRRLMIYLKKEVSRIAATTLFEPNVKRTWNAFSGRVERLLDSVKSRFGIDRYRLILDESTTTADLIDRNIMYAKIYIKPTKAIEFIALDFIVTNNGAAFED